MNSMKSFPRYPYFYLLPFLFVIGLLASGACAADDEQVFEAARQYTVKVRTQVGIPFFGDKRGTHIGAGFVVDSERGLIMTNAHVAARSPSKIRVAFYGGEFVPAKKLYVDPYIDLAILELAARDRPAKMKSAKLDCTDTPAIGHPVGAFGHPWDLSFTGTRGIISGITSKYPGMLEMVQTDAPINPGNSGGPLISLRNGEVLGINTASRSSSQNTNFAVPMNHACQVLDLLRAGKDPAPPDFPMAFLNDIDETNRLIVAQLYEKIPGMPLREGDVIDGVDGIAERVVNRGQLIHLLRGRLDRADLRIRRGDREMVVHGRFKPAQYPAEQKGVLSAGILIAPTPWRDFLELVGGKLALMVHYVERGSTGDAERIKRMDLIYTVDGKPVDNVDELFNRIKAAFDNKQPVVFKFIRLEDLDENLFSYIERPVAVTNPRLID
jgi:S1-C subfamily serine protease